MRRWLRRASARWPGAGAAVAGAVVVAISSFCGVRPRAAVCSTSLQTEYIFRIVRKPEAELRFRLWHNGPAGGTPKTRKERQMTDAGTLQHRRWQALALLCIAQFVVVLDASITNVALPTIGESLGIDQDSLSWVVTAYALTFGGFLLLGGRLADLLGRRRVFMGGLILFAIASLV